VLQVLQFCFCAIRFRQAGVLYGPGFCVRSAGMESESCQAAHDSCGYVYDLRLVSLLTLAGMRTGGGSEDRKTNAFVLAFAKQRVTNSDLTRLLCESMYAFMLVKGRKVHTPTLHVTARLLTYDSRSQG
jgi:hypothetical protein